MKKILLIIVSVALLSSCEGFLNELPKHNWAVENTMTNYNNAVQSVNGIYQRFVIGDNINMALNTSLAGKSGFMKNLGSYDLTYTQTSGNNTSIWSTAYSAINACNLAINGIPSVPDASFPTATSRNELIGEARCLRGYMHSLLLFHYSRWYMDDSDPYGIIYRDKVADADNIHIGRSTIGESWKYVLDDLDFAIENMSDKFETPRKVSKVFAKAYKAKLLLIRGSMRNSDQDLRDAKTLIDDVISTLPASRKMESDMAQLFENSWDSKENIFVRYLEDNSSRTTNAGYWCEYGLSYNAATKCLQNGVEVPHEDAVCGVSYGLDWIKADPRFFIATGKARNAETWDDSYSWTWTKIYRKGRYAGKLSPVDEKYAVYYMRIPELYIMQAELRARTGASVSDAIAPINTMRSKRTNPVLPTLAPKDKDELMELIFKEYVNELILENGSEFFASIRFQKDGKYYIELAKETDGISYDKTRLQWAIPNDEMINNRALNSESQNPGQN